MLFLLYVLLLVYFLFFFEEYGRVAAEERAYRYNLIPFLEIRRFWIYREQLGVLAVFSNIFGNVIGFIPYGFILPVIAHKCRSPSPAQNSPPAPGWSAVRRRAMPAIRCSAALSIVVRLHVPLVFPSKYDAGFLFGLIAADKPILSIWICLYYNRSHGFCKGVSPLLLAERQIFSLNFMQFLTDTKWLAVSALLF